MSDLVHCLELDRREFPEGALASSAMVGAFDPRDDGQAELPEGCQYSDSSGGDLVLVDQSAEHIPPFDRSKPRGRDLGLLSACWRLELQPVG